MPVYNWNSVSQSVPAGNNFVLFLLPNPNRVSLLISSSSISVIRVSYIGGVGGGVWWIVDTDSATALTYRDFGPPVRDAVYVNHIGPAAANICVTEIYKISGC